MTVQTDNLFRDKKELIDSLYYYRNNIFSDATISEKMMDLFVKNYVETVDVMSLDRPKDQINNFMLSFMQIFLDDYLVDTEDITNYTIYAKGSYGTVFLSSDEQSVVKVSRSTITKKISHCDKCNNIRPLEYCTKTMCGRRLYDFIIDFFNYIVWKTVILAVNNRAPIYGKIINNYFFDIQIPFMMIVLKSDWKQVHQNHHSAESSTVESSDQYNYTCCCDGDDGFHFYIGYMMKKYNTSFGNLLGDKQLKKIVAKKIIVDTIYMICDFVSLEYFGIIMSHRDLTPNNIMIDQGDLLHFIDLGFSLIQINFIDQDKWIFGSFFDKSFAKIIDRSYDIILFLLYLVVYEKDILEKCNYYNYFASLICFDDNSELVDLESSESIWLYPYKANIIDRDLLFAKLSHFLSTRRGAMQK
jgi:hypothetical protein